MSWYEPIHRAGRRAAEILLWCGAGLGTLSILAAISAVMFGIVPLVFTSGSMSPEIPTGSLGLARTVPASELREGDVVSVTAANDTRVTHRIIAIEDRSGQVVLTLKGDTNPAPDQESYLVAEADRVFFSAPHLGRAIMVLTSPWAMFVGGLGAAALLFWAFRHQPKPGPGTGTINGSAQADAPPVEPAKRPAHRTRIKASATLLAVGITTLLMVTTNSGTAAYWTDNATVTTTGFATHQILQPDLITCTASADSITISTPTTDPRYTFWASAHTAADDGAALGNAGYKKMIGTPPSVPTTTFTTGDLPALVVNVTYWLRIHSRVGATGTTGLSGWESLAYRRQPFSWNGSSLSCGEPKPPVITFFHPTNGSNESRDEILSGCAGYGNGDPLACGTVTHNGEITNVEYILQRTRGGANCWNGSWNQDCMYKSTSRVGNKWAVWGANNRPYFNSARYSYTLRIKVTIKVNDDDVYVTEEAITYTVR